MDLGCTYGCFVVLHFKMALHTWVVIDVGFGFGSSLMAHMWIWNGGGGEI